jgi:hypothetical protein
LRLLASTHEVDDTTLLFKQARSGIEMAAPPQQFEGDVQCQPSSTCSRRRRECKAKAFDPGLLRELRSAIETQRFE